MYELLFSSQQPKAKDFRRHCYIVLYPHVRQQLTQRTKEVNQQAIIGIQREHQQQVTQLQQAITDGNNQIQAIQYENIGPQGEIRNAR